MDDNEYGWWERYKGLPGYGPKQDKQVYPSLNYYFLNESKRDRLGIGNLARDLQHFPKFGNQWQLLKLLEQLKMENDLEKGIQFNRNLLKSKKWEM